MNYRQKSKQDGTWAFVKYKDDLAIYASCQNCGFTYPCYQNKRGEDGHLLVTCEPCLERVYKYCPNCGLKMHLYDGTNVYKLDKYIFGDN